MFRSEHVKFYQGCVLILFTALVTIHYLSDMRVPFDGRHNSNYLLIQNGIFCVQWKRCVASYYQAYFALENRHVLEFSKSAVSSV